MSKSIKIIILAIVVMITCCSSVQASGETSTSGGFGDILSSGSDFINKGSQGSKISEEEAIEQFLPIGRILVQIATIVLVIVGLILGIKYMTSGADQKANVKLKLIWYVISVALVYGAVGIFNIVRSIMGNILG